MERPDRMELERKATTMVGSVEKALSILDVFVDRRRALGVTEVSKALGLNFSTTHHLVSTLCGCGYLEQDPATRKYRLGLKALEAGLAAQESFALLERARPILRELAASTNENVNLGVLDRAEVVYIEQAASSRTIAMFTRLGARVPLYCTGVGKVYLSAMGLEEARAIAESQGWRRYTGNTLADWPSLERDLAATRKRGYAMDREEREEGVACVAAPVRDFTQQVCAAISVSGPAGRILPRAQDLAAATVAAAGDISVALGYPGPTNCLR